LVCEIKYKSEVVFYGWDGTLGEGGEEVGQISVDSSALVSGSPSNGVIDVLPKGVGWMCGKQGWLRISQAQQSNRWCIFIFDMG
jgi:hypothetical protein